MTAPSGHLPFASHFIELRGHRFHYLDEGPKDAPPLLCLHGNPTWSFYWRRLVSGLSDRWRVLALDHLGCGLTDKPQDGSYRLDEHIRNVEAFAAALDLRDLTVVVHDWGGAIGLGFAGRQPDRVARLVITNTGAFPAPVIPLRIAACRIPLLGEAAVRGLNGFAGAAVYMATEKGLDAEARAGLLAPYDSWANRIATHRFVMDIPMSPGHPSWDTLQGVERGLRALQGKPALLVWGEKDWCFTPWFRREFERRLAGCEVERLDDVGHYVMEDAPERVVPRVRRFLEEHPVRGGR